MINKHSDVTNNDKKYTRLSAKTRHKTTGCHRFDALDVLEGLSLGVFPQVRRKG